jgi:Tfp pilus assembly protein PilO
MGFVFYQFMYAPEVEAVNNMERNLNKLREEINRYKPFESRKDELNSEIARIRDDLVQLERVFPSVKDDVEVKRFVEKVANEFDIRLTSYRTGAINDQENYLERSVNYQTSGRTIDYLRFFDALARRDQVIHIYSLVMKQTSARSGAVDRYPVSANFTISSYVYKPTEEEPVVADEGGTP